MVRESEHSFHIVDYVVFAATILISLAIGLFFAFSGGRQRTTSEFMVGGRMMKFIPVAVSLLVTFESSIMMLGTPAEVYVYGTQIWISALGWFTVILAGGFLMVPLFHPLKLTSVYEYLELRFNSRAVRLLASSLGGVFYVSYMGIVLFAPALVLQAVTGFSLIGSIFLVASVAMVYTALGGLKAVIWTDVFQAVIMFTGMIAIAIKGTVDAGGVRKTWARASDAGRLNFFNFDPDPTVRHTFWCLYFGTFIRGMNFVFNQSTVQRVSATSTTWNAKKMLFLAAPSYLFSSTLAVIQGVVAFSYYDAKGCDPLESKQITNPNQIIPFMVMEIFSALPGMPGLFLASLFSASLSTVSSGLSSLSAMIWEDVFKHVFPNISDFKATVIAKTSVLVFGCMSCGVAVLISLIGGTLVQITASVLGALAGPVCGLFFLACLTPWANSKGALLGTITSAIITCWISFGAAFSPALERTPWLPSAPTDNCPFNMTSFVFPNVTMSSTPVVIATQSRPQLHGIEHIYRLSYMWYSAFGAVVCMIVGFVASAVTGFNKESKTDAKYIAGPAHVLYSCLPDSMKHYLILPAKTDVEENQDNAQKVESELLLTEGLSKPETSENISSKCPIHEQQL